LISGSEVLDYDVGRITAGEVNRLNPS